MEENGVKQLNYSAFVLLGSKACTVCYIISCSLLPLTRLVHRHQTAAGRASEMEREGRAYSPCKKDSPG